MTKQRELELKYSADLERSALQEKDPAVKNLLLRAIYYVRRAAGLAVLQEKRKKEKEERKHRAEESKKKLDKLRSLR